MLKTQYAQDVLRILSQIKGTSTKVPLIEFEDGSFFYLGKIAGKETIFVSGARGNEKMFNTLEDFSIAHGIAPGVRPKIIAGVQEGIEKAKTNL